MTPTPLHRLADGARQALAERAAQVDRALANELRECISESGRVSVNMKPGDLERLLDGQPRLNKFEQAEQQASRTGQTVDEVLRVLLGSWYERRVDFEERAGAGRRFHYGALNIGGMGTPRFGRYCVVDGRPPGTVTPDPVWIAEDSLRGSRFRGSAGDLDWSELANWVSACDMAAELALVKLQDEGASDLPLSQRICRHEDYIEALSTAPIARDFVEEVRSETDDDLHERAARAILDGASPGEELELALQERIRAKAESLGIQWRVIRP